MYAISPLDRCLRDAQTALQHICTREVNVEFAGRLALHRDPQPGAWAIDYYGEG